MKLLNKKIDTKNNIPNEQLDKLLFTIAKREYEPIPESIHNNILKTIHYNYGFNYQYYDRPL